MKSKLFSHNQVAVRGLVLGLTLFATGLASAQNFVKNPDFEEPLGTNPSNNWTVVYDNCDPWDFLIAGRSTMAHKDMVPGAWDGHDGLGNDWSKLGGCIAHNYFEAMPHCYFKQVVTGLTPLASYECSAWMVLMTRGAWVTMLQVYMEVLGGAAGNVSKRTPYVTDNANNNPEAWKRYVVTNTASTLGKLEIRLHYNVIEARPLKIWEYRNLNAYYDHVSVMPVGQTEYLPPYQILAFTRTNQDITLTWQTVMNNRYRIQYSTNLSDSMAWLERGKNVDTNFFALGTNFTFTTNLLAYNASFDTNAPLFFRIHSTSFKP